MNKKRSVFVANNETYSQSTSFLNEEQIKLIEKYTPQYEAAADCERLAGKSKLEFPKLAILVGEQSSTSLYERHKSPSLSSKHAPVVDIGDAIILDDENTLLIAGGRIGRSFEGAQSGPDGNCEVEAEQLTIIDNPDVIGALNPIVQKAWDVPRFFPKWNDEKSRTGRTLTRSGVGATALAGGVELFTDERLLDPLTFVATISVAAAGMAVSGRKSQKRTDAFMLRHDLVRAAKDHDETITFGLIPLEVDLPQGYKRADSNQSYQDTKLRQLLPRIVDTLYTEEAKELSEHDLIDFNRVSLSTGNIVRKVLERCQKPGELVRNNRDIIAELAKADTELALIKKEAPFWEAVNSDNTQADRYRQKHDEVAGLIEELLEVSDSEFEENSYLRNANQVTKRLEAAENFIDKFEAEAVESRSDSEFFSGLKNQIISWLRAAEADVEQAQSIRDGFQRLSDLPLHARPTNWQTEISRFFLDKLKEIAPRGLSEDQLQEIKDNWSRSLKIDI